MATSDILYVNAYAVTRHYGGPEEGGWWYDRGVPLASVPVRAKVLPGHGNGCRACSDARDGIVYQDGTVAEMCDATHLEPDPVKVLEIRKHLEETLEDVREGDISSVNGGVDVWIMLEDDAAEVWPSSRPRYE